MTISKKVPIFAFSVVAIVIGSVYYGSSHKQDDIKIDKVAQEKILEKTSVTMHQTANVGTEKKVQIVQKKKDEVKLKPHHLYVRSSAQIEKDVKQRKEVQKRFFQMKRMRDKAMKEQQFREQINKTKGKENV